MNAQSGVPIATDINVPVWADVKRSRSILICQGRLKFEPPNFKVAEMD